MNSSYHEIISGLYLGTADASKNSNFIKDKKILTIVNCTKDIKDSFSLNLLKPIEEAPEEVQKWLYDNSYYIKYYRIPVDDSGNKHDIEDFYEYTMKLLPIISSEYSQGRHILVHCLAGVQRSASFIVAFLMYHYRKPLDEMMKYVLQKKPNVFFFGEKNNFIEALKKIDEKLHNKKN